MSWDCPGRISGTMGMSFIYFSDIVWNAGTICEKGINLTQGDLTINRTIHQALFFQEEKSTLITGSEFEQLQESQISKSNIKGTSPGCSLLRKGK